MSGCAEKSKHTMDNEVWKDIPGYEGRYQASTAGRIRSLDRYVRLVAHGKETKRLAKGQVLRPAPYEKGGHLSVVLGHNAHGSPVHRLIALTFIGPCPAGCEVCHNDGNPKNNAVDNLRYDTRSNNIKDAYMMNGVRGKLTVDEVRAIRDMLEEGRKGTEIARLMGVSVHAVSHIKTGRTYAWLKP